MKFPRNLISFAHAALSCRNFTSQREFRVQIKMFIALRGVRTVAHERAGAFLFRYPGHAYRLYPPSPPCSSSSTSAISLFYEPEGTPV